jgi:hypothetical protein
MKHNSPIFLRKKSGREKDLFRLYIWWAVKMELEAKRPEAQARLQLSLRHSTEHLVAFLETALSANLTYHMHHTVLTHGPILDKCRWAL